jgi:hypothetical protein
MLGSNKCGALINPIQISQSGQDKMAPRLHIVWA